MKITKLARREAKSLFQSCVAEGILDETRVRNAVTQVVERKPRGYAAILSHFQRLVRLDLERRTASVESAQALEPSLQTQIQATLNQLYGAGLQVSYTQNPGLIGGLRIRVGSDVVDGSIQARLTALKDNS
jgi:F-type H+-transporting ATPase subunit delta